MAIVKILVLVVLVTLIGGDEILTQATPTPKNSVVEWPIILVPGDGGSQLEAKLNRTEVPHFICPKKTNDYYSIWINLELLPPFVIDCFVQNMMLKYDNVTHTTSNADGVDIRVPGFGDTDTVSYLDPSKWSLSQYFHNIIDMAVSLGYVKGKNLHGAPFDFRKSPNEFQEYYENLTTLIEETYYNNGNKKVVIIGHSMGNPVMLYFFHSKPQAWKDKFIRTHISIAAPWGGSVKTVKLFASGYNLDHYRIIVNPTTVRPFQRSMTSSAYLLPSSSFWLPNETLVYTQNRNYTVADYKQFFDDIKYPNGWLMYQDTKPLFGEYKPPGVEVHCVCGTKMDTPTALIYGKGSFPDYQPTDVMGDGDGTVNIRSCQGCLRWSGKQKQQIVYKEFEKEEHLDLLSSPDVVAYVKTILQLPAADWASRVKAMAAGN